ncbi:MAG: hypothetical protein ACLQVD_21730 [Capsulimonadaceae bacterium]
MPESTEYLGLSSLAESKVWQRMLTARKTVVMRLCALDAGNVQAFSTRRITVGLMLCLLLIPLPTMAQFTPTNRWTVHRLDSNAVSLYVLPSAPTGEGVPVLSIKSNEDKKQALFILNRTIDAWEYAQGGTKKVPGLKQVTVETKGDITTLVFMGDGAQVQSNGIPGATWVRYDPHVFGTTSVDILSNRSSTRKTATTITPSSVSANRTEDKKRKGTAIAVLIVAVIIFSGTRIVFTLFKNQNNKESASDSKHEPNSSTNSSPSLEAKPATSASNTGFWPFRLGGLFRGRYNESVAQRCHDIDRQQSDVKETLAKPSEVIARGQTRSTRLNDAEDMNIFAATLEVEPDATMPDSAPHLVRILSQHDEQIKSIETEIQTLREHDRSDANTPDLILLIDRVDKLEKRHSAVIGLDEGAAAQSLITEAKAKAIGELESKVTQETLTALTILEAKENEISSLMEEYMKNVTDDAYAATAKMHMEKFIESITAHIEATNIEAQKAIDAKAENLKRQIEASQMAFGDTTANTLSIAKDDAVASAIEEMKKAFTPIVEQISTFKREIAEMFTERQGELLGMLEGKEALAAEILQELKGAVQKLDVAKDGAVAFAKEEIRKAHEPVLQHARELKREIGGLLNERQDELLRALEVKERQTDDTLQALVTAAQNACDTAETTSGAIIEMLTKAQGVQNDANAALRRQQEAIGQAREAAEKATLASEQISRQMADMQDQLDRIDRVDMIMTALQGAIRQIQSANSAPPSPDSQPQLAGRRASGTLASFPALPRSGAATDAQMAPVVTKGTPEFDYLTLFVLIVNAQWKEILNAARSNDERYFTAHRLTDLDKALYGDATELLGTRPEYRDWVTALAAELRQAQSQRIRELAEAGMTRIEGRPGEGERARWLEPDHENSIPTSNSALAGTFAEIEPGKGGYKLNTKALRPSMARFYRLT